MSNNKLTEKVIAVGVVLPDRSRHVAEEHLEELGKLVESAGGAIVASMLVKRDKPDPATWIGSGKAEQIKTLAAAERATLIVFDDDLSPAQTRNLERITDVKVIDRSALILDIFAGRARSREARTQVELAQLEYMLPRLTRQWSHLERQAGGIGTRGVGETQLEIDRRIVRNRIGQLKGELEKIERTRETQRKSRASVFTIALVGYTNAGKSTLFNRLTGGSALAEDKLFATLDAKTQRAAFPAPRPTVVIDTVGFVRKLPHHLVASFRSTMEEAVAADLVLHVIDGSHPQADEQRVVGEEVLRSLGIPQERVIDVYNKEDVCGPIFDGHDRLKPVLTLSALTGRGIEELIETIRERELAGGEVLELQIPHGHSRELAKLHELAVVYDQRVDDGATRVTAWVPKSSAVLFEKFSIANLLERAKVS
ncbi:MAG TPA: GTPase HflX [Thermoanaerobaculia bacterium]|nr:GTPase HflX [Thermoanaerobaculia bacterium]